MKIRYSILWFDDNPESIEEDIKPWLIAFLDELGFYCDFKLLDEYTETPSDSWRNYDLIVTDLNLGVSEDGTADMSGRRIIDDIRNGRILTDVLIYSANPGALHDALRQEPPLERVSICARRGELEAKLADVINITVKKAQSLPYVRGQFIAQAIDLEHQIDQILRSALMENKFPSLNGAKEKLLADYTKRKSNLHKKNATAIEAFTIENIHLLCDQKFVDAFDRQDLARQLLREIAKLLQSGPSADLAGFSEVKDDLISKIADELSKFFDDVIYVRNTLAHVKEEVHADGSVSLKGRGADGEIVVDDAWCKAQREILRRHVANLEILLRLFV